MMEDSIMATSNRILLATILPSTVILAIVGATMTYDRDPVRMAGSAGSGPTLETGIDSETLARLADYGRATGADRHGSTARPSDPLPDVETMIERLAARLAAAPADAAGWRMLGWSYSNTGQPEKAAAAYAKAAELETKHKAGEQKQ